MIRNNLEQVERIRATVEVGLRKISDLQSKVKDAGFNERARTAGNWFNDVESLLSFLEREPEESSRWLVHAELMLSLAVQQLDSLQKIFDTYGPNVKFVG